MAEPPADVRFPLISEIGEDLLRIHLLQRIWSLFLPFLCIAGYGLFAMHRVWPGAVACLIYLSFVTYGSVSHDLVHRTLGLPRFINELFLTLIELAAFRSGHAYRRAHLHHHSRFPKEDDIEGAAAKMSLFRSLLEGMVFQWRIMIWAILRPNPDRGFIIAETVGVLALLAGCLAAFPLTPIFTIYAGLMIAGSWIIPLVTSYVPHNPSGETELTQTTLFRGKVLSVIALQHLYHLEHHLYPMVPHHHWPTLARRLDPHFERAGIKPVTLWF